MEKLSKERMGEIAIIFVKHRVRQNTHLDQNRIRREMGSFVKDHSGLSFDEVMTFVEMIARELVEEAFSKSPAK